MVSERLQRRIERLLDRADTAADEEDWDRVAESAQMVLALDAENVDAQAMLAMVREAGTTADGVVSSGSSPLPHAGEDRREEDPAPTSFANGRYTVQKFLGEGGKKRVYLAHDSLLGRDVAFALIKTEGFDQTSKERIAREAQAMGRLGVHPNVVAVLDLGQEDDGSPYMVTELMSGGDVEGSLETAEENWLPLERIIEIGKAVCEGLEFAHGREIIHRDLKPGNVWLTEDGTAKIGDFGLAMMTDRSRLTREAMMIGTPFYMPPEQATGGDMTPKSDLYSLGAMLYEMVTGRPPFLGDDEIAIIGQHLNTPPVAPTWHNPHCPRPLEALIMRLLAKDPSERPDDARDVYNALDAIDLTARGETVERENTSLESLAGGVFVGRQAEMDQLKAALEDVLGGRGRLVTLVGEPGIGKTRTSEELATYAGLRGAQVLWGRCYETGGQPPYWPWVQAIRSYVREIDSEELRRQMGSSASVVAEIITDVKDRLPDIGPPQELDDPDSTRFRLFDSITSFLKSASQTQPLVLILDDLHWSDRPSLTFLEFIARELSQSRVMLICTYRDMELNRRHPLTVTLGDLARERLYERVVLRGLAESDVGRFIEIAAGFTPPTELSATVHRHTEGNPLFVTEVVRELVQSGELAESQESGSSTWSVRIPEGVREVIGRRLDRLSEHANEVLTVAAVVGRDFHLNALQELSEDTSENQLLDIIDESLDAKIIEELADAMGHFQFTHALMQETLTSELSLTRRVRIHARIAETLERIYGERADESAAVLAYHYGEAEAILGTEKLVHYSVIAGDRAFTGAGFEDAKSHYQNALTAIEGGDDKVLLATVISGLARCTLVAPGEKVVAGLQNGWDLLIRAFDMFAELGDNSSAVELAQFPAMFGPLIGTADVIKRALDLVEPTSIEAGRLNARYSIALLDDSIDPDASNVALDRAAEIADLHDDKVLKARVLIHRLQAIEATGDIRGIVDLGEVTQQAVELADDDYSKARLGPWLGSAYLAIGERKKAEEVLAISVEMSERTKDPISVRNVLAHEVDFLTSTGDYQQALQLIDSRVGSARWGWKRFLLQAEIGQIEGEIDVPTLLWDDIKSMPVRFRSSYAEILATAGFYSSNAKLFDLARDALSSIEPDRPVLTREMLRISVAKGILALSDGDLDEIERVYGQLLPGAGTVTDVVLVPYDKHLGMLTAALGRHDDAIRHFEASMELCRKGEFHPQLAWTQAEYAQTLLDRDAEGDSEKAITLQDEALAAAQEMGIKPLVERILASRGLLRA